MSPKAARRLRPFGWPMLFAALVLIYLGPLALHPDWVAFPPRSAFTDLLISHLPNAEYVRASLASYRQLPLWNTQAFAGQPFAADPLAGLWYPPAWVTLAWPLPLTFNLLLGLHLAWSGWGLFRLLRAEGLDVGPAVFGGAAWAGTPKLVAHLGAGHVSLVYAVAWTPWLLLAVRRAAREGGVWAGALAGATFGLTFLADPRWGFYEAWLVAGHWAAQLWGRGGSRAQCAPEQAQVQRVPSLALWKAPAAFAVFAGLVSAGLALPLLEFIRLSNRTAMTLAEAGVYSLPPHFLLGLVVAPLGGVHEWMTYAGVFPLLLALACVGRRLWFWLTVAALAGMFALGTNSFLYPLVFGLAPGLSWMRVPARAWFLVALALCALGGHGAQAMADAWPRWRQQYAAIKVRLPGAGSVLVMLITLTVVDLARVDYTLVDVRTRPELTPAAAWLRAQPGLFRVYSPSFSLPPGDGLEHVDGVDPLQLAGAVTYLEAATGIPDEGYSVTVPPFADGAVATANAGAQPDAELLGQLNVRYVAAEFPLTAPGLRLVQTFGSTRVYENEAWRPRAWLVGSPPERPVVVLASPDRIEVQAAGPSRLVLSEVAYPGWQVAVDGRRVRMEAEAGLLRSVTLGPGEHKVVFSFRPTRVYGGAVLSVMALVGLLGLAGTRLRAGRRL